MFTLEAIKQLAAAEEARQVQDNIMRAFTSEGIAAIPDGISIKDLEAYMPTRRRQRGTFQTNDNKAFAEYVIEHKEHGATVFVNAQNMQAVAVLNLGDKTSPGHCDNRAALGLKKTAAYGALLDLCSRAHQNQRDFAEFLEDWAPQVVFFDDSNTVIEPKKALAAVRKLTIESVQRVQTEQNSLSANRSTFEQVGATSLEPIPVRLVFSCIPYYGLNERSIGVRVGVVTGGKDPAFTARIINREGLDEELAREFSELVSDSLPDTPVTIGEYTSK